MSRHLKHLPRRSARTDKDHTLPLLVKGVRSLAHRRHLRLKMVRLLRKARDQPLVRFAVVLRDLIDEHERSHSLSRRSMIWKRFCPSKWLRMVWSLSLLHFMYDLYPLTRSKSFRMSTFLDPARLLPGQYTLQLACRPLDHLLSLGCHRYHTRLISTSDLRAQQIRMDTPSTLILHLSPVETCSPCLVWVRDLLRPREENPV